MKLSLKARGLYYLIKYSKTTSLSVDKIKEMTTDGTHSIRQSIIELENNNLLERVDEKSKEGKYLRTIYNLLK